MNEKSFIKPVIILGAMKAGTTALYNYLKEHPQICTGQKKEPEYFCKKFGEQDLKQKDYNDLFSCSPQHIYSLEASTGYTKFPVEYGVPKRIKEYGLNPKFIYIVRNPYDRIRSHFNFMQPHLDWKIGITNDHLLNTSKYFTQLEQFLDFFPKHNFLVLDFEELKNSPETTCQKVFRFLDLSHDKFRLPNKVNTNKTVGFNRKAKILTNKVNSLPLPYRINKFLRVKISEFFPPEQRLIKEKEKKLIYSELREDMQKLHKEFGIDVSRWGFKV